MSGRAWFSDCERYRYALLRAIDLGFDHNERCVNFVMLNPSTATDVLDDPTIRRCMGYARRWGYGSLMVTNLFALRATDPRDLKRADDPVGPKNDRYLALVAQEAELVVAAWGTHGAYQGRDRAVLDLLDEIGTAVHCLGVSKGGHPKHPLYLKADMTPIPLGQAV